MWHKSKNRRRRWGKVRLSLRTPTSLGCVRTEPVFVICTTEVSSLTGKKGRDQCDCFSQLINEILAFINCSVLFCRNTQLHDGMPLVPLPSTGCSKIHVKKIYFPFIRILIRIFSLNPQWGKLKPELREGGSALFSVTGWFSCTIHCLHLKSIVSSSSDNIFLG